jgi:hypothetical protein
MDGALYRPTVTTACGTATAADDSLGYRVIKFVKGREFQYPPITRMLYGISVICGQMRIN